MAEIGEYFSLYPLKFSDSCCPVGAAKNFFTENSGVFTPLFFELNKRAIAGLACQAANKRGESRPPASAGVTFTFAMDGKMPDPE